MEDDILQEVPESEIPKVLSALKKEWPKHFLLYQYINIMEEYKKSKLDVPQALYRYGDLENGVYILRTSFPADQGSSTNFFIYTNSEDLTHMSKALTETSRIPWKSKEMLCFEVVFSKFTDYLMEAAASKGANLAMKPNYMLWFPPEDEIELLVLSEDVSLRYLDDSHIPEVDKNWPHRFPGSEKYLTQAIRLNFGIGLFRKSDNKMLSSSLSFHSGGIFVLYTDTESRGKGYAEIIIRNMVKEIQQRGRVPFCTILEENIPSQNLFRKIGFKDFTKINFVENHV